MRPQSCFVLSFFLSAWATFFAAGSSTCADIGDQVSKRHIKQLQLPFSLLDITSVKHSLPLAFQQHSTVPSIDSVQTLLNRLSSLLRNTEDVQGPLVTPNFEVTDSVNRLYSQTVLNHDGLRVFFGALGEVVAIATADE